MGEGSKYLKFYCNICGSVCHDTLEKLGRETISCVRCGSTVRWRSIIHILSIELFGKSITLPEFPESKQISGIGMSDWTGYANPLEKKLGYLNTFYHQEPKLDITSIDPSFENIYNFIISSDVFEHIKPPISVAFKNLFNLLKKEGFVIFTVPYGLGEKTQEYFPDLFRYSIEKKEKNRFILKNTTKDGKQELFENLKFHGGEGSTLEMRLFSKNSLITEFSEAGFNKIKFYDEPYLPYGIYFKEAWSLPMSIRK
jgi:hypothetical protein